ncbi:MAG: hypothetical protein BA873_03730 [Desulfobulbaceae bacterium C00003063]|nr:MAG: hypothetical protein BA873_03730 [Desulfobulbaceae bacterium C00003063]
MFFFFSVSSRNGETSIRLRQKNTILCSDTNCRIETIFGVSAFIFQRQKEKLKLFERQAFTSSDVFNIL